MNHTSFHKNILPRQISVLLLLAIILVTVRVVIFHSTYFTYILWNLFLALLPFMISSFLLSYANRKRLTKPLGITFGIIWLLLLPNAPYLVTDMVHLGRSHSAPLIYDTLLLFCSAWVGLLLGMYSLSHIETMLRSKYRVSITSGIVTSILLITAFGMYLGRFLRFNSWDLFSHTSLFVTSLSRIFIQPADYPDAYLFTGLTFLFLIVSYRAWKYTRQDGNAGI